MHYENYMNELYEDTFDYLQNHNFHIGNEIKELKNTIKLISEEKDKEINSLKSKIKEMDIKINQLMNMQNNNNNNINNI